MTTTVLGILVVLIAIIDARSRRIPEFLCVGGILFAFFGAMVAPADRFDPVAIGLPRLHEGFLWAVVVWLLQPGMVLDLSRLPVASLRLFAASVDRRGVMQIAIPLIGLGWLAIAAAPFMSPLHSIAVSSVIVGAAIGLIGLGVPHLIGRAVRGGGSIGSGDCLMLAMVGALAGPQVAVVVTALTVAGLVFASLIASVSGRSVIPIGPVIALATLLTLALWSRFWPRLAVVFADPVLIAVVWSIGIACLSLMGAVWLAGQSRRRAESMRWVLLATCGLLAAGTSVAAVRWTQNQPKRITSPLADLLQNGWEIASGGGALSIEDLASGEVQLLAGSHSFQAMGQSDQRGVDWIELGLVVTADGEVVALRDWGKPSKHWLGDAWTGNPLTKSAFLAAANNRGWTPVDLTAIARWLRQDDSRYVLLNSASKLSSSVWTLLPGDPVLLDLPLDVRQRMLAMVDDVAAIERLETAGLSRHIWVIRPEDAVTNYEIVEHCRRHHPVAVAAHYGRLRDSSLPETLKSLGIPSIAMGVRTSGQKMASRADAVLTDLAGFSLP